MRKLTRLLIVFLPLYIFGLVVYGEDPSGYEVNFELIEAEPVCRAGEPECGVYFQWHGSTAPVCYVCEGDMLVPMDAQCNPGDLDYDGDYHNGIPGDIDLEDFKKFQLVFTGPKGD